MLLYIRERSTIISLLVFRKNTSRDYRQLGTSELHVSSICLGTMTFGQQNSEDEAHAQLNYAFANGVNLIDTAEMYPVPFRTETIVGNWLKNYPRLG
jgi:aryl-alcohol dehydrogenase-like predicted oxidoreductase